MGNFIYPGLLLGLLTGVVGLLYLMYIRVPTGMAYVRSGWGGQKVLLKQGAFVIPGIQHITAFSLQTYSVELAAMGTAALRTQDLLRVDITLVASIRLAAQEGAILTAARTFGQAGLQYAHVQQWRDTDFKALVETLVAGRELETLHQQRSAFTDHIARDISTSLAKYGLELVSLSLVQLQQTAPDFYDPKNCLDVKGLALLEQTRLSYSKQRRVQQREDVLSSKRHDFDVAIQRMEWERKEFVARLQHIRFKAEADAKAEQELEEIQIAKELALEMVQRDVALTRIQTQQELAAARRAFPFDVANA
ncbi:MAG: SPFH domain-containing protein [Thiothrix sp.]|uniref:SPFH domain-containing protein n=1 Tax=Thiothrix sp. TaxID=1032 RepID=UPI00262F39C9|nr:SPFH domain-containing protein [Thiothrix sp.]MDD5392606.1 SPFH domain-containing protein [Thiothrix sp.]